MPPSPDPTASLWEALGVAAPFLAGLVLLALVLRLLRRGRKSRDWRAVRAEEQMRAVARSGFERRPLLNREEARLLPLLERAAREGRLGHRVMAQTSLGEVIRPLGRDGAEAFAAINAKRLDFAIFDRHGLIACAVEYHGTGHFQGAAEARDRVKREALRKAGVPLVEVYPDFEEADLLRDVRAALAARG
jgi:hypothetical protein